MERHFSADDLRDLFRLNETTISDTHDTYKCKRCVAGMYIRNMAARVWVLLEFAHGCKRKVVWFKWAAALLLVQQVVGIG